MRINRRAAIGSGLAFLLAPLAGVFGCCSKPETERIPVYGICGSSQVEDRGREDWIPLDQDVWKNYCLIYDPLGESGCRLYIDGKPVLLIRSENRTLDYQTGKVRLLTEEDII